MLCLWFICCRTPVCTSSCLSGGHFCFCLPPNKPDTPALAPCPGLLVSGLCNSLGGGAGVFHVTPGPGSTLRNCMVAAAWALLDQLDRPVRVQEKKMLPSSQPSTPFNVCLHHQTPSNHPRNPGSFSGALSEDFDKWLPNYNHISVSNHWDPTIKLENVIFHCKVRPKYDSISTRNRFWAGTPCANACGKREMGAQMIDATQWELNWRPERSLRVSKLETVSTMSFGSVGRLIPTWATQIHWHTWWKGSLKTTFKSFSRESLFQWRPLWLNIKSWKMYREGVCTFPTWCQQCCHLAPAVCY